MSETYSARRTGAGAAVAGVAADWLSLAAAPAFAMMAAMTLAFGGGMAPVCMGVEHESLMSGMVPMYLLMGAFHSGSWLRLIAGWRG